MDSWALSLLQPVFHFLLSSCILSRVWPQACLLASRKLLSLLPCLGMWGAEWGQPPSHLLNGPTLMAWGWASRDVCRKSALRKSQLKKGAQKKSARPNRAGLSGSVSFNHLPVPVGIYCPTAYLYIWTTPWLTVKGKGILILKRKAILLALMAYRYASTQAEWKGEQSDGELHLTSATSKEDKLPRSLPGEQLRRALVCQPPFPCANYFSCGLRAASGMTCTELDQTPVIISCFLIQDCHF